MVSKAQKFWNKMAQRYSKSPISDELAYQKKLHLTQTYFEPDMEVLEFGCGTGSTALIHSKYVKHIRAIDFSSEMIGIAQEKANTQKIKNVTFETAPIDELKIPNASVDCVLGLSVLHLLENKEIVNNKVYKALKPGGLYITSTPCLNDVNPFMAFILKMILPFGNALSLLPQVKFFSVKELKNSLIKSGFEISYFWQPAKGKAIFIIANKKRG